MSEHPPAADQLPRTPRSPGRIGRVLVIGHQWPDPAASAAGQRLLELLRTFTTAGWHTCFGCAAATGPRPPDLAALGVAGFDVRLNDSDFDRRVAALSPELVVFDRFMTEEQYAWRVADACPTALRCLDTEDLHSLRDARRRWLAGAGRPAATDLQTSYRLMATTDLACRELAAIHRSDLSLLISDYELELLRGPFAIPPIRLHHCPFMLDPVVDSNPEATARRDFVCIGNFLHAPNADAVRWLKQAIWPRIRAALGDVVVHVYGACIGPAMQALNAPEQGFLVHGWIDDADAALRAARVSLAPLRFGAGLKGKLVQSMRNGTPSVTTPIGAEGLAGDADWPGLVAGDAASLAAAAVSLYRDDDLWRRKRELAGACLARFDAGPVGEQLLRSLDATYRRLDALRRDNFTGRMLSYHRHHASRYLGKWIEAKNRDRESGP